MRRTILAIDSKYIHLHRVNLKRKKCPLRFSFYLHLDKPINDWDPLTIPEEAKKVGIDKK